MKGRKPVVLLFARRIMNMEKLANRLRGCVELHIPLGIFNALLVLWHSAAGILFCIGFLAYEFLQDSYKKDQSYKDIFGWLTGLVVGWLAVWILQ